MGKGLTNLVDVMELQSDALNYYGMPINIAKSLMKIRIEKVSRSVHPFIHQKPVDIAKILKINLINIHTPTDNLAAKFLKNLIEKERLEGKC